MNQTCKVTFWVLASLILAFGFQPAQAVGVGEKAPDFKAIDTHNTRHKLSDYRGRYVVLEWHNKDCPFVKAQYEKGKMQSLQTKWTKKAVLWFRVISSAPGKQGYVTDIEANGSARAQRAKASGTFLDPKGIIGKAYGAKTTPHIFIINPKGRIIYAGAIDNAPLEASWDAEGKGGEPYINYVERALRDVLVKKKAAPEIPSTTPYGCSVKY
jgi:alkyl hydroperoxide reductase subunit AhpC